ncbi:MAG: TRAP transporter small permease [Deltaproteobacteria bacterium]|jgi:TRAP-type C4-dicarboxylate transport system permease small subunit|nr:TRAP transporter small permease [Deltaproteobacteria bacterium]
MKRFGNLLTWLINGLSQITGAIAALSIVGAALIVTEGVIVRKIFGASTIWQIEASVFLLIYAVFVGAPFVQKHEHHLNVDLVLIHLSPRAREITLIAVSIIACILSAVLACYAWPMWWESLVENAHSESLWGPPLWIPYFFLPFGISLLFLQYIVHIIQKVIALRSDEVSEAAKRFELKDIEISGADPGPQK